MSRGPGPGRLRRPCRPAGTTLGAGSGANRALALRAGQGLREVAAQGGAGDGAGEGFGEDFAGEGFVVGFECHPAQA